MHPEEDAQTTLLLRCANAGDQTARNALLELVYAQMHSLAQAKLRDERSDHTLQATALVHEAWLRIFGADSSEAPPAWEGRAQFLGVAARAMRHVLVDHARRRDAQKRSPQGRRVELDVSLASFEERAFDLVALDESLERLAARDAELARVVELRYFGGLTTEETGRALGLSVRQVEGAWVTARGWLRRELGGSCPQ
jgi:RNA polymerase sigma factor (TIGR02999 family)